MASGLEQIGSTGPPRRCFGGMSLRHTFCVAACLSLVPLFAAAQGNQHGLAAMRTAEIYAAAAASATDLDTVRADLRRVIDCLEGPNGPDYRREVGDPCTGAGAVNDLPNGSVNKIRVEKAIRLLAVGVTFHDFPPAHFTAQAVDAVLREGVR